MSFLGTLTLIFVVLKLLSVIDWSWWIVLLPLYGGLFSVVTCLTTMTILHRNKMNKRKKQMAFDLKDLEKRWKAYDEN